MFPFTFLLSTYSSPEGALCFRLFTSWYTLLHTTHNLVRSMRTNELVLENFRALKTDKPRSKIAFLRGLYPEIVAAQRIGHSQLDIHRRLVRDGIDVSYPLLRNYISRIRRERSPAPVFQANRLPAFPAPKRSPSTAEDPLANAIKVLNKPKYDIREAMCNGDPTKKKLI